MDRINKENRQNIRLFLEKNSFLKEKKNIYTNDKCKVRLIKYKISKNSSDEFFAVEDFANKNDNSIVYSGNLNIYWLIGYLIDKRFIDYHLIKTF
jgi:hypothetical protein